VLGGPSAARWSGIEVPWPCPFVLVPVTSRREPHNITVLREPVADDELVLRDGMLLTRPARTVVDCLRVLPQRTGVAFLDRALQQGWITFDELVTRTQMLCGRRGAPRLVRHVRTAAPGTRSEAERRMAALLRRAGIRGWQSNIPVTGVGILDFVFLAARVAIEIDGRAWHSADYRFQTDRRRQNRLVLLGWTVLRFTWEDLSRHPERVLAEVRSALAAADRRDRVG
jgi:very-short-patch-repair endonuclease